MEQNEELFKKDTESVEPPLRADVEAEAERIAAEEERARVEARLKVGKVPLHPAFVRLPLRAEGVILSEWTGYPGFLYDEATLNDMAEMAKQLDIELNPALQFVVAMLSIHAVKILGYYAWKRAGKPKLPGAGESAIEETRT